MSPESLQALEQFAAQIHWGAFGNPDDLDHFLDFILVAHRTGDHAISFDAFSAVIDANTPTIPPVHEKQFTTKKIAFVMLMFDKYKDGIKLLNKSTSPNN